MHAPREYSPQDAERLAERPGDREGAEEFAADGFRGGAAAHKEHARECLSCDFHIEKTFVIFFSDIEWRLVLLNV